MTLPAHLLVQHPHRRLLIELALVLVVLLILVLVLEHLLVGSEIPGGLLTSEVVERLLKVEIYWSWSWQRLTLHLR